MLLLASYCGGDNPSCTDERPCVDCLGMCNVFEVNKLALADSGDKIYTLDYLRTK